VLVTGAGGLIGGGIARRLAAAGATVAIHYRSNESSATDIATAIRAEGGHATLVHADLTEPDAPRELIAETVRLLGHLDALVNNAGFQPPVKFDDIGRAEFNEMLDINVTSPHLLSVALAQHIESRGASGSIVHVASIEGTQPAREHAHYNASKAALLMHTKSAAMELAPRGLRVNAVSPGLVARPGIEEAWPSGVSRWMGTVPLGRMGTASDIGDACVFLVSPLSRWMTGVNLIVDGGMSILPTY